AAGAWCLLGVVGVSVADDEIGGTLTVFDLVVGVALDGVDGAVTVVGDDETDVLDVVDAFAAVPAVEDHGAGLRGVAPAALVHEPARHRVGPGVEAHLVVEVELVAEPGDEHGAPGGVLVVAGGAAVPCDGLLGAFGAGVPVLEFGAAARAVGLGDADLFPGQ